jgi:hypothetical protein
LEKPQADARSILIATKNAMQNMGENPLREVGPLQMIQSEAGLAMSASGG